MQTKSLNYNGDFEQFQKPWILNFFMGFGMSIGIINWLVNQQLFIAPDVGENGRLKSTGEPAPPRFAWQQNLVAIPGLMDIIGSVLIVYGLKQAAVSVQVMMRSFTLLCTAGLSVFYLKKNFYAHNQEGGGSEESSQNVMNALTGLGFIILGQIVVSFQVVLEEHFMVGYDMEPDMAAGTMGFWCAAIIVILSPFLQLLPGNDEGSVENFQNDFILLKNSWPLSLLVAGFCVSIQFQNMVVAQMIKSYSGMFYLLCDIMRTAFTWGVDLIIYQFISDELGEALGPQSWLQVCGFLTCFLGTQIQDGNLFSDYFHSKQQISQEEQLPSEYATRKHSRSVIYYNDGGSRKTSHVWSKKNSGKLDGKGEEVELIKKERE